ncbi:hypothetical protein PsorP6_019120 [Peronosclerospora sorghi]|nr:hypothetical protein PsorP6_019120 [Peronosclerospora sorghi]
MTLPIKRLCRFIELAAACFSLTACVSAQAMTLDPPTFDSPHANAIAQGNVSFDSNTTDKVENQSEERAPLSRASTKATIDDAVESGIRFAGRFTEHIRKPARLSSKVVGREESLRAASQRISDKSPSMSTNTVEGVKRAEIQQQRQYLTILAARTKDNVLRQLALARARNHEAARKLTLELLYKWKTEKKTLDQVFTLLEFKKNDMKLFEHPLLDVLISYAFHNYEELLKLLLQNYNEEVLARLLAMAKKTSTTAEKLERELHKRWKAQKLDIHDIFSLLKLDKHKNIVELLTDPKLTTWFEYVSLRRRNPVELMISAMRTEKDFQSLNELLVVAQERGVNADILKDMQFEVWKQSGEDIFVYLKLDKLGDKMLQSPSWKTWFSYLQYAGENYNQIAISKFEQFSDEKLREIIARGKADRSTRSFAEKLEESVWMKHQKSIDEVFKVLKLEKMGASIFTSRGFYRWNAYMQKRVQNPDEFLVISELEKHFGRTRLDSMMKEAITNAKRTSDARTLSVVVDLQKQWTEYKNASISKRRDLH